MKVKRVQVVMLSLGLQFLVTVGFAADLTIQTQVREGTGPTADGGVMLKEGESLRFDAKGSLMMKTAGFWKGLPDKLYTVSFQDKKGDIVVVVEFQGTVKWDQDGKITETSKDFLPKKIKTRKHSDDWIEITNFELKGDRIKVVSKKSEMFS